MDGALAPELAELRERLRYDTPFWARNCATILTTTKQAVRLEARPWQLRFDEALEEQRAAGRPMRAIVLKARKLGFSTWIQAKYMQRVTQLPYQRAVTVSNLQKGAGELMDMAERMYANLPTDQQLAELVAGEPLPFSVRPQLISHGSTRTGARYMELGDKRRRSESSVIETMTAGAKGAGRGGTPSLWHGSEAAWYDDPEFITGALSALPLEPETIAVLESTANGFNHFFETWDNAVRGAEDPETGALWTPLFFGWQDNPYNVLAFVTDAARERFITTIGDPDGNGDPEEQWLVEEFGVTPEQLNWRRQILHGPEMRSNLELFHQEHPATPEQAFIGSGTPVFSAILVSRAISEAKQADEPVRGVLRGLEHRTRSTRSGTVEVPERVLWVPESAVTPEDMALWGDSRLLVWEHPTRAVPDVLAEMSERGSSPALQAELERAEAADGPGQYVAFADIAQGVGTAGAGDWTAVQVLNHVTRMQAARLQTKIAVHDLPLVLFLIGLYFNEATLAPEVNSLGVGVVDALAKDYRYRRLYRRRRAGDDARTDQREQLLGWMTDLRTKPLMETTFGQALSEGTHGLRDLATGREFTTYVVDDKGRHGAQKGAHDDLAMAFMGAHRVAAELRPRDTSKRSRSGRGRIVEDPLTGY